METIIILGMHRSGTSCLTGCLQQFGLNLGAVSDFNEYNLKGNKEDDSIGLLNEQVLKHNSGTWRNPPKDNLKWTIDHEKIRDKILKNYSKLSNPIGFKDPRMIFTLPFWQQKLNNIKFIGSFRHPLNVAQSLYARKNIRIETNDGLKLWCSYNSQLLKLQNKYNFDLVNFDLDPKNYLSQVKQKAENINLNTINGCSDFFDDSLRNQIITKDNTLNCPDEVMLIYNELLRISNQ